MFDNNLGDLINNSPASLVYISNTSCNICEVLKPKIKVLLKEKYPKCKMIEIDITKYPVISGQLRVFTAPTLILFFEGKESHRFGRNVSLNEIDQAINKAYKILFK